MSSTKQLEWRVDSREYELFREFVEEEHDVIALCFPSEVMRAMRAFIDKDRAVAIEEELGTFEDVLVDSFAGYSRRRTSSDPLAKDDLGGEDTTKIRCEVPAELKEEFAIYVAENSEWGYGEALGRAMNAYRDGGREQRLADRLRDMIAAVESCTDTASTSTTTDATGEAREEKDPYHQEEKIAAIHDDILDRWPEPVNEIEEIGGHIPEVWFTESIDRWCAKGDREQATDKTRRKYLDLVVDEFGLGRSGENFVVGDLDGLAFERKDYAELTTEERVEAVRVKLLRQATSGQASQASAADIQNEFFDGDPSDSVAHNLRKRAAEADGFGEREAHGSEKTVYVHPSEVTDETLREAAGLPERDVLEAGASDEMDALMNASIATDGGTDQ